MPDRKNKVRIGFLDPENIYKVVSYVAIWIFFNGSPLGGRHSWRPAKIKTVCYRGHVCRFSRFWKKLNQKSLGLLNYNTQETQLSSKSEIM